MQQVRKDSRVKSRRMCSVPQCTTYCIEDISLHKFPLDPLLAKKWKHILKIGKPLTKYMQVCSKHFTDEDFFRVSSTTQRKRLKKGAVPSQKLPVSSYQRSGIKKDRNDRNWLHRNTERSETEVEKCEDVFVEEQLTTTTGTSVDHIVETGMSTATALPPLLPGYVKTNYHTPLPNTFSEDKSTQTDFCDFFDLSQILNTDEKLSNFTGVNHQQLEVFTACSRKRALDDGVSEQNIKLWLILVLCKLKTNLSFSCLAILFGMSLSSCSRIFYSMVSLLAISVKPGIYWPPKEYVLANMPKCFDMFRNTRVILDCTEVKVQRLKCLNCRILSYSHYKRMHTMKFLIGVTPSGLISYVSPAYGGRASDKAIFNKEELIKKLDPYDAIMTDKGVLIEEECASHFVRLIQPPFLRKKKQLSKDESTYTAQIARARIHVERAIQRIKNFAILNDQIDWFIIPYIDDIMTVIAVTVNMSRPILADSKF